MADREAVTSTMPLYIAFTESDRPTIDTAKSQHTEPFNENTENTEDYNEAFGKNIRRGIQRSSTTARSPPSWSGTSRRSLAKSRRASRTT